MFLSEYVLMGERSDSEVDLLLGNSKPEVAADEVGVEEWKRLLGPPTPLVEESLCPLSVLPWWSRAAPLKGPVPTVKADLAGDDGKAKAESEYGG